MFRSTKAQLTTLCLLLTVQGAACLVYLLSIPGDPSNAILFNLSSSRLLLAAALVVATLVFAGSSFTLRGLSKVPAQILNRLTAGSTFGLLALVSLIGILVCTSWPYAALEWQARLQRIFPLVLFATLASGQLLIFSLAQRSSKQRWLWILVGLAGVLSFTYLAATNHYAIVNREYWLSDQEALLDMTRVISADPGFTGTREFMPGFPLLAHGFMDTRLMQPAYFAQGKLVNISLSMLFLAGIFIFVRDYFGLGSTALFTLLTAVTLFIYKAAYFQPELTYYFLSFIAFGLLLRIFRRPQLFTALIAGLLLAASHYTKASILPTVALFALAMLAQAVYLWLQRGQPKQACKQVTALTLVLIAFLVPLSNYLKESNDVYGSYFYNVTTEYYIWLDSWGEAKASEQTFQYYNGLPDVPAEQLPSLQNYLKTHTLEQMADRMAIGIGNQLSNWWNSYALVSFPVWLLAGLGFLAFRQRRAMWAYIQQNPVLSVFLLAYFAAHFTAFAWYGPIADYADRRFTYGQYLPLLFVIFHGYKTLLPYEDSRGRWFPAFLGITLVLLAAHVLLYMPYQFLDFHWYGK